MALRIWSFLRHPGCVPGDWVSGVRPSADRRNRRGRRHRAGPPPQPSQVRACRGPGRV